MNKYIKLLSIFPILLPIWEEGPFREDSVKAPEKQLYLEDTKLREQKAFYSQIKSPKTRSLIVRGIGESGNPSAVQILEKLLASEDDEDVISDILLSLYIIRDLSKCEAPEKLIPFMADSNDLIRAYSTAVYLKNTGDTQRILELLGKENSLFVINLLWTELSRIPEKCKLASTLEFMNSEIPENRAGALRILLPHLDKPLVADALEELLDDKSVTVRVELAKALGQLDKRADPILLELSEDSHSSVRAYAASSNVSPERMDMHMELSGDRDWEVRRLACIQLGSYSDDEVISTLIDRLADKSFQVREAAEGSLIRIRPEKRFTDVIMRNSLSRKSSKHSAVIVLGELDIRESAPQISRILENAKDEDLIIRCMKSLALLDYKKSSDKIKSLAVHKSKYVRIQVAASLGMLNVKDSYNTVIKLSNDKDWDVANEAVIAMGNIKSDYFNNTLYKIIKDIKLESDPQKRACTCWSLSKIDSPDKKIINQLSSLALKKIVPFMMSPKDFDSTHSRLSACFSLIDMGRKNQLAQKEALKVVKTFKGNKFSDKDDILREYGRQAELYMKGETAEPVELRKRRPTTIIRKVKK